MVLYNAAQEKGACALNMSTVYDWLVAAAHIISSRPGIVAAVDRENKGLKVV